MNQRIKELHEAAVARGQLVADRAQHFATMKDSTVIIQALREAAEHSANAVKDIFVPLREEMVKLGFDERGSSVYVRELNRVICEKQRDELIARIRSAHGQK